jgi:sugar transferase EpsL
MQQCSAGYIHEQARQHEVRPDIAGWAQVNNRNTLTWEEKFAPDVWHIDHLSSTLDVKIIALTISKIIKREGISPVKPQPRSLWAGSRVELRTI